MLHTLVIAITAPILLTLSLIATESDSSLFFLKHPKTKLFVEVSTQSLYVLDSHNRILKYYPISTGKTGTGETLSSGKTPRGLFSIHQTIGNNRPAYQAYLGRQPSRLYDHKLPDGKNIISRIFTLEGLEKHNLNTLDRTVYIHGTPYLESLGKRAASQGCVRMDPYDIIELYTTVATKTLVYIYDSDHPLPNQKPFVQVADRLSLRQTESYWG